MESARRHTDLFATVMVVLGAVLQETCNKTSYKTNIILFNFIAQFPFAKITGKGDFEGA